MLQRMKGSIGNGSIQFRVSEAGYPLSPQLVGDAAYGEEDFINRSLDALPKRYYDIQSFVHAGHDEFQWRNGDATKTTSVSVLNLFIWLDIILYLVFCYFTIINYSFFISAKSWTTYTGTTWSHAS